MFGSETLQISQSNMPVNMGGSGAPIGNYAPSLALTYLIADDGSIFVDDSYPNSNAQVGEIVAFAGTYEPAGYLKCDGRLVNIIDYPNLFDVIGTTYGGDGSTTFALPDLQGRSVVEAGAGAGLSPLGFGETTGSEGITLTSADMPALTLNGTALTDTLYGGDAGDTLNGLGGDDTLVGNGGNDTLDGGDGSDTASYRYAAAGISVSLKVATAQATGGAGSDTLTHIENIIGSNFKDKLVGDGGANVLNGLGGKDKIFGGAGADVLTGGAGPDDFVFKSLKDSGKAQPDLITDLSNIDSIDLSGIDANTGPAGDQAFHLISGAFTHAAGELRLSYDSGTGRTSLQGDTNGDAKADFNILIAGDHHDFTGFVL
jgi:microcystin-dependent protein